MKRSDLPLVCGRYGRGEPEPYGERRVSGPGPCVQKQRSLLRLGLVLEGVPRRKWASSEKLGNALEFFWMTVESGSQTRTSKS